MLILREFPKETHRNDFSTKFSMKSIGKTIENSLVKKTTRTIKKPIENS